MRKMKKAVNVCFWYIVFSYCILSNLCVAKADSDGDDCEIGIAAVGDYSDWNDLNDLSSPIQINKDITEAFSNKKAKKWKIGFRRINTALTKDVFVAVSLGGKDNQYADNVDLMIYSGHGLLPNKHGSDDYAFALDYDGKKQYAKQGQMYLGNKDLEWLVTFTCNLCNGGLKKVGRLAKGIHAVCGYSTRVLLVPTMGKTFAGKLKNGVSVKEAFLSTAKETQPWKDSVTHPERTAAVFTTKSCANDCIWGYGSVASDPKAYSKDSSQYIMYTYKY